MNDSALTPITRPHRSAWNKGKLTGPKPPLRPGHVWSIRRVHCTGWWGNGVASVRSRSDSEQSSSTLLSYVRSGNARIK
jgi:hypothetical protein